MPRRMLLFAAQDKTVTMLPVLRAEMEHPGWMRYVLEPDLPGRAEPTIVWKQVPQSGFVELQTRMTDEEILSGDA
jgi:hypothetical protein